MTTEETKPAIVAEVTKHTSGADNRSRILIWFDTLSESFRDFSIGLGCWLFVFFCLYDWYQDVYILHVTWVMKDWATSALTAALALKGVSHVIPTKK